MVDGDPRIDDDEWGHTLPGWRKGPGKAKTRIVEAQEDDREMLASSPIFCGITRCGRHSQIIANKLRKHVSTDNSYNVWDKPLSSHSFHTAHS